MRKVLLALCSICLVVYLLSGSLPRSQSQTSFYDIYVGTVGSVILSVTNGPPNGTITYNITQSSPGVMGYALEQPGESGPWADTLTVPISLNASGNGSHAYYFYGKRAGASDQNTCSPELGCTSDSPLHWTVTPPASQAKIQYLKDGAFVDVPATLNVLKGDTVTFKAIPLPVGSRFYSFDPRWGGTSGATGQAETTSVTFNTVSKNSHDYKTVTASIQVSTISGDVTTTANVLVGSGVTSISFEKIDTASILDDNPNAGGGKRTYPDKNSPSDTVNRRRIRVKAVTSFAANQTIYFKSFDMDDPSTDASPVDTNGPTGNDNRGNPGTAQQQGLLSVVGGNGTTNSASAKTDTNGLVSVDLMVTMQPGDNFVVGASHDLTYLNGLSVNGITLKDSSGNAVGAGTPKAKASPLLTVWRRMHVEVDSMWRVTGNSVTGVIEDVVTDPATNTTDLHVNQTLETNRFENGSIIAVGVRYTVVSNIPDIITIAGTSAPPISSSFILVDDDDFNGDDGTALDGDSDANGGEDVVALGQTFSRMQTSDNPTDNVYAAAYILPVYDGGGDNANNNSNVGFVLNQVNNGPLVLSQINSGRSSGMSEGDNFWVVYIQVAYQPESVEDSDPDTEDSTGGYTPPYINGKIDEVTSSAGVTRGADGSLLFIETMRDRVRYPPVSIIDTIAAPHEVGHQFGLKGDVPGFGIMFNSTEAPVFVDKHLNVLRWRIKSPGQP